MSAYTIAIICPSCGGNASLTEGAQVVHCHYCDHKSLASSPLGYPTLYLPPQISQEDARLIAEKYVQPDTDSPSPPPPPLFHQAQLLFIPFWRVQARMVGWVSGQAPIKEEVIEVVEETAQEGRYLQKKHLRTGGEPLKKMLVHLQESTFPAAEVKELGVLRLRWEQKTFLFLPFKPEAAGNGYVITPSVSAVKARREAETTFIKRVLNPYREYTDFFQRIKLMHPQLTLFYYPLWIVKGEQGGNFTRRVIDATDGAVLAVDALLPPLHKKFYPAALAAAAGWAGFLFAHPFDHGPWGTAFFAALAVLVYLGYKWDARKR